MAINLKPVDVAVIGLGRGGRSRGAAAGARGSESRGHRSGHLDGPAKISSPTKSTTTCAPGDLGAEGQERDPHGSHQPFVAPRGAAPLHPMMNAIGGTSIHYWAQSWRLKPWDFKTRSEVDQALRRERDSGRIDARRLADQL